MNKVTKQGLSMVELIVVITILAILMIMMIGGINPLTMINRGHDSQRKKDIARLKVSFEEYYNDKGCYPTKELIDSLDCNSDDFAPWITKWPCDPSGIKYKIAVENNDCPHWFKLMANLQDHKDKDIPDNWYSWKYPENFNLGDGTIKMSEVNYGTSSTNISWYEFELAPECKTSFKQCYTFPGVGRCNALPLGVNHYNAYVQHDCLPQCQVPCCFDGVVCEL